MHGIRIPTYFEFVWIQHVYLLEFFFQGSVQAVLGIAGLLMTGAKLLGRGSRAQEAAWQLGIFALTSLT